MLESSNKIVARFTCRIFAACLLCVVPILIPPAHAARIEISGGHSWTLLPYRYTDVEFAEWIGDARPVWKLRWSPAFSLGRFGARDNVGAVRLDNVVWVAAAGARFYLWRDLFFGFQGATTKGKTDALSTPYEFVSSLGWQGDHWQIMMRHISNGEFHTPNHGETMVLIGLAF